MKPKIYLAGPSVFMPDARRIGTRLKEVCVGFGVEALCPLEIALDLPENGLEAARAISRARLQMVREAHAVVADLSPFRGPHCDDGTAVEIGMALQRGIPIFGYSTDLRPLADRIAHTIPRNRRFRDAEEIEVENLGQPFNAMIAGALTEPAFPTFAEAISAASLHFFFPSSKG